MTGARIVTEGGFFKWLGRTLAGECTCAGTAGAGSDTRKPFGAYLEIEFSLSTEEDFELVQNYLGTYISTTRDCYVEGNKGAGGFVVLQRFRKIRFSSILGIRIGLSSNLAGET